MSNPLKLSKKEVIVNTRKRPVRVTKASLIRAAYILEQNKSLTPQEVKDSIFNHFGFIIELQAIYRFRYKERQSGGMLPYDAGANLTKSGVHSAVLEAAKNSVRL